MVDIFIIIFQQKLNEAKVEKIRCKIRMTTLHKTTILVKIIVKLIKVILAAITILGVLYFCIIVISSLS
jgi:hypothetical protein